MVQTDVEIKPHTITCSRCKTIHKAELDDLKFRPGMSPFLCPLCAKGIELGDVKKLEQFMLSNYNVEGTIVDYIISKLK